MKVSPKLVIAVLIFGAACVVFYSIRDVPRAGEVSVSQNASPRLQTPAERSDSEGVAGAPGFQIVTADHSRSRDGVARSWWQEQLTTQLAHFFAKDPARALQMEQLFAHWAQADPTVADKLAELYLGRLGFRPGTTRAAAFSAAELATALQWLAAMPAGPDRLPFLSALGVSAVAADPGAVFDAASLLSNVEESTQYLGELVGAWIQSDREGAAAWTQNLPDGALRETLIGHVVQQLVQTHPAAAADFAATAFANDTAQADGVRTVISRWAYTEPAAAAAWLRDFPASDLKNSLLETLVLTWRSTEPEELQRWMAALPVDAFQKSLMGALRAAP